MEIGERLQLSESDACLAVFRGGPVYALLRCTSGLLCQKAFYLTAASLEGSGIYEIIG